jgi:hypothetical protein
VKSATSLLQVIDFEWIMKMTEPREISSFMDDSSDPRYPVLRNKLLASGMIYLSEGKTFHQFDETWGEKPRYCVSIADLVNHQLALQGSRHFRLGLRDVARSTDERTSIFCLLSPGTVSGNTAAIERQPGNSPRAEALCLLAICNSFPFDWALRITTSAHVSLFILKNVRLCEIESRRMFFVHSALRLTCNHAGYEPLWREQLGDSWYESKPAFTWPVLEGDDKRWAVRAAIDAVVADAYGMSREQYAYILSTFSHRSYPRAPELCLACYDELKVIGVEVFTRKYDPYWDIPLNENLPEPVVDLFIAEAEPEGNDHAASRQELLLWLAAEPEASQYQPSTRRHHLPSAASYRTSMVTTDDETYELLKLLLKKQGVMTSSGAQAFTGLDAADLRHMLKRLVDEGVAVQEGQGRGTRYRHVER